MFAGMRGFESALRPSLRAKRAAERRRRSTERALERVLHGPRLPFWRTEPRHRMQPPVLAAASDDLRATLAALREPARQVPASALAEIDALLHDRDASPLYGLDPQAAAAAARRLRQRVVPAPDAKRVTQPVPARAMAR